MKIRNKAHIGICLALLTGNVYPVMAEDETEEITETAEEGMPAEEDPAHTEASSGIVFAEEETVITSGEEKAVIFSVYGISEEEEIIWTSSDPAVASVDEAGMIRAGIPGRALIRAEIPGAYAQLAVTVEAEKDPFELRFEVRRIRENRETIREQVSLYLPEKEEADRVVYDGDLEMIALRRAEELAVSFLPERPGGESISKLYEGYGYHTEWQEELFCFDEEERSAEEIIRSWAEEDPERFDNEDIRAAGFARVAAGNGYLAVLELAGNRTGEVPPAETEVPAEEEEVYTAAVAADSSWIRDITVSPDLITVRPGESADLSALEIHPVFAGELNSIVSLLPLDIETEITVSDPAAVSCSGSVLTGMQEGVSAVSVRVRFGQKVFAAEIAAVCLDGVFEEDETQASPYEAGEGQTAESLSFTESSIILYLGEEYSPQLVIEPADAVTELMWSVGSGDVVTRDKTGRITPAKEGHTAVHVLDRRSFLLATLNITIRKGAPKVTLDASSLRLKAGNTRFLNAAVTPADATLNGVVFSSSAPEIVSVDERGLLSALAEGEAVISAVSEDGRAQASCTVRVSGKTKADPPAVMYLNEKGRTLKAEGSTEVPADTRVTILAGSEGEIRYSFAEDVQENGKLYTGTLEDLFAAADAVTLYAFVRTDEKSDFLDSDITQVTLVRKQNTYVDPGDVTAADLEKIGYEIPEGIWVSGTDRTFVYNGRKQTFSSLRVYDGRKLLKKDTDYKIAYSGNLNAGTGSLTVTGKGNYREKLIFPVEIAPADISQGTVSDVSVKYRASGQYAAPAVTCGGVKLKAGKDFIVSGMPSAEENLPEGFAKKLTIEGKGNYAGTLEVMLYVSGVSRPVALSKAAVSKIAPVVYERGKTLQASDLRDPDGNPVQPVYKKKVLGPDQYTASLQNAGRVGTAVLVLSGTGVPDENGTAFTGVKKIRFRITGEALKDNIVWEENSSVYDGTRKDIVLKDTEGNVLEEGEDYALKWSAVPRKAGKYTVTVSSAHYSGTVKITYRILPVSKENVTFTVNDRYTKSGKPEVSVYCGSLKLKKGTDYTVSCGRISSALTQKVTVKLKGNYSGTLAETVTLQPRALSELVMTVKDSPANKNPAKNYSSVKITDTDGKTLTAGTDYIKPAAGSSAYTYVTDTYVKNNGKWVWRSQGDTVKKTDVISAGTKIRVTVRAKGKGYTGSISATYMVTQSGQTLSGAKVSVKKTYIYTGSRIIPEKKDIVVTLKDGTELPSWCYEIVSVTDNISPSAKAAITLRGINSRGYGGQVTGYFTIRRRSLGTTLEETPECGADAYYDGTACVCSPGFAEEGGMCVYKGPDPETEPACGADAYFNGKACVCWPGYEGDGHTCTLRQPEETPDPSETVMKQLPDLQKYLAVLDNTEYDLAAARLRKVYTDAGFDPSLIFFVKTVSEHDHRGVRSIRPVPDGSMYDTSYPILIDIWVSGKK